MSDGSVVLDASAVLAFLHDEPGADVVARLPSCSVISAINLSEVMAKLTDRGMPGADSRAALDGLDMDVRVFDAEAADIAVELRRVTRSIELSLEARACLALSIGLASQQ